MSDPLAMLRIEHKLDLILHALKNGDPVLRALLADGDALAQYGSDTCPVCEQPVRLTFNAARESFGRDCGCRLPFNVVPGISKLLTRPEQPESRVLHLDRSQKDEAPDNDPEPSTTTSARGTAP